MQDHLIFQELEGNVDRLRLPKRPRVSRGFVTVLLCLILVGMIAVWFVYYQGRDQRARLVESWDVRGTGEGELSNWPIALTFARDRLFVCDIWGGKVLSYDPDLKNPIEYGAGLYAEPGNVVGKLKRAAVQMHPGKLVLPRDVDVSESGEVYVLDYSANSIQVYSAEGEHLRRWGNDQKADSFLPGDGEFFQARSLAVDRHGNAYVADAGRHRIIKFDRDGKYLKNWGGKGSHEDQFRFPRGLFVDSEDQLWVCDTMNSRIKVFDLEGKLLRILAMPAPMDFQLIRHQWNYFYTNWRNGADLRTSYSNLSIVRKNIAPLPYDLAVDLEGNCFVTDQYRRLLKFSREGRLMMVMRSHDLCGQPVKQPYEKVGEITNNNRFMFSTITLDQKGDLYFAYPGDTLIRKFNTGR